MIVFLAALGMEWEGNFYEKLFFKEEDAKKYLERMMLDHKDDGYVPLLNSVQVHGDKFIMLEAKCKQLEKEVESLRSREMNLDDIADYTDHLEKVRLEGIRKGFEYAVDMFGVCKDGLQYIGALGTDTREVKKQFNPKEVA